VEINTFIKAQKIYNQMMSSSDVKIEIKEHSLGVSLHIEFPEAELKHLFNLKSEFEKYRALLQEHWIAEQQKLREKFYAIKETEVQNGN
jgi:hypothetical protein